MKTEHHVTEEANAGACGLDGAELTHSLLLENQELLAENARLKRNNIRSFWFWLLTTGVYLALLVHFAIKR